MLGRDRPSLEECPGQPLPSGLDEGEAVESGWVSRHMGERGEELPLRARVVASREEKLAEMHRGPGRGLRARDSGLGGQSHCGDGAGVVAEQLTRIRDAGIGGQARLQLTELVERGEPLAVAAKLHEGIPDRSECSSLRRRQCSSPSRKDECLVEAVPREGERREGLERHGALLVELERPPAGRFAAVVRDVSVSRARCW